MTASWLFGAAQREPSMSEITTIGLDLAKHDFQVHGSMRAVGWCCASSCGAARWWRSCGARLQLDHAARGSAATDPPTSGILLRAQPLQDLANHPERAVALSGQHSWNGSELISKSARNSPRYKSPPQSTAAASRPPATMEQSASRNDPSSRILNRF